MSTNCLLIEQFSEIISLRVPFWTSSSFVAFLVILEAEKRAMKVSTRMIDISELRPN